MDESCILQDTPAGQIIHKQGYLVKKGHIRHNWRTRWFVLKKNSLEYFKNRQDAKPKGKIPLLGASLHCPVNNTMSRRPWMLVITTVEGKEYSIQASDEETRNEWKMELEEKIRRLDPSKRGVHKRGITLSRSLLPPEPDEKSDDNVSDVLKLPRQKEIVEAMQDISAGVKLTELRRGGVGSKHVDRYFTGMDAVDWLITWYFSSNRHEAILLCNCMLRNGLFHALREDEGGGGRGGLLKSSSIADDRHMCNVFKDSSTAKYIFVSYVSTKCVERLFSVSDTEDTSDDDDGERDDSSSMSSPDSITGQPLHTAQNQLKDLNHTLPDKIIRQGYLLKQGHVRKNWKIRRFVLLETQINYYRIEKIKTKPQGLIPLCNAKVYIIDDAAFTSPLSQPNRPKRYSLPPRLKDSITVNQCRRHMFCVETEDCIKYIIQAESDQERFQWITDIEQQIKHSSCNQRSPTVNI